MTVTLNSTGVALVQSWIATPSTNFGIIIRAASGTAQLSLASSKNGTAADRPMLSIATVVSTGGTFTPAPITNPTTSANTAFYGFDGKRDGYMAPVGMTLDTLYFQYLQWQQNGSQGTFTTTNPLIHLNGNSVLVDVTSAFNVSSLQSTLQGLGMQVTGVAGPVISGWMPMSQLANLAMTSGLNFAQESAYFISSPPADTTQGAKAIGATNAASDFGVNGTGITVGVLSDSFNSLNGYCDGRHERPTAVKRQGLARSPGRPGHGRRPGHDADRSRRSSGRKHWRSPPPTGDRRPSHRTSRPCRARRMPTSKSMTLATSISPSSKRASLPRQPTPSPPRGQPTSPQPETTAVRRGKASFTPGQAGIFPGSSLDAFGSGNDFQQVTIPVGSAVTFDFQWNQPFASVGGRGSQSQMDIFLLDRTEPVARTSSPSESTTRSAETHSSSFPSSTTAALGRRRSTSPSSTTPVPTRPS